MGVALSPRLRLGLLVAAAAGLWLMRDSIVGSGAAAPTAAPRPRPSAGAQKVAALAGEVCTVPTVLPERNPILASARGADPFSVPAPPPPKPVKAPPPPPPPPLPPPPLPTLPYKYMGRYEVPNQPAMVFLSLGGTLIDARVGDTLDGGFKLTSIGKRELVFLHLQKNLTLRMPIDGDPS